MTFIIKFCLIGIIFLIGYVQSDGSDECKCSSWGQWSGYGGCTKHCGGGLQMKSRTRTCEQTVIYEDDDFIICSVNETFPRFCNTQPCGCDDICSPWSSWSNGTCSVRCGGGSLLSTRTRSCAQSPGCSEKDETNNACNTQECTGCNCLDWANWSDYGYCSATCGIGVQRRSRNRSCIAAKADEDCTGAATETETTQCSHGLCCDETCTEWSEWDSTPCSAACDHGSHTRTRTRVCSLEDCYYIEKANASCKIRTCESTCMKECGSWSSWLKGACTMTCGGGISIHSRNRDCPTAFNDCVDDILRVPCNSQTCPKPLTCNEACTNWSDWNQTSCSSSCDQGTSERKRSRSCNITNCDLEDSETMACKLSTCPKTCNSTCSPWAEWNIGQCSVTCDNGTRQKSRARTCKYPDCSNIDLVTEDCKHKTCEETCNSTCSSWALVSNGSCSTSCDHGQRVKVWNRTCNYSDCITTKQETETCIESICKETCDSKCTTWGEWFNESCSVTCGGGYYVRQRLRGCPVEIAECPLREIIKIPCNNITCPDICDARCTSWGDWISNNCSSDCDGGRIIHQRVRGCPVDISDCKLIDVTQSPCNTHICPETCNTRCFTWGIWDETACSAVCDGGTQTRRRTRSCPSELKECSLLQTFNKHCNNITCKDYCDKECSSWSTWTTGSCSVSCDGGQRTRLRSRTCRYPTCSLKETATESCNQQSCQDRIKYTPDCRDVGRHFYPHPYVCTKYYQCVWGNPQEMECPRGTAWDDKLRVCDHIWKIPNCIGNKST